nr:basement membrane proteoglycan-like [Pelodiscus sinensis]|eukprot:XP_025035503.1 basement membrane proteoglycan-like [Pelodiscus sinensis]
MHLPQQQLLRSRDTSEKQRSRAAAGAPTLSGIRFFRNSGEILCIELPSPQPRFTSSLDVSDVSGPQAGEYSCESWRRESGKEITSQRSQVIAIAVVDPPPQPKLSVDPPSGVVNEGFSLNITCMAPGDPRKRRFHFYKDGAELVPGDLGSEISTVEPSTGFVKVSVVSIRPQITGEFTCGYEEIVGRRGALSPPSQAVNVTVNTSTEAFLSMDLISIQIY